MSWQYPFKRVFPVAIFESQKGLSDFHNLPKIKIGKLVPLKFDLMMHLILSLIWKNVELIKNF